MSSSFCSHEGASLSPAAMYLAGPSGRFTPPSERLRAASILARSWSLSLCHFHSGPPPCHSFVAGGGGGGRLILGITVTGWGGVATSAAGAGD